MSLPVPSTVIGAAVFGLGVNFLYDLTKTVFGRLSGKADAPSTDALNALSRSASGDIDAISDAVEEDIIRIQRPIVNNVYNINITGGSRHIINLDRTTLDFAQTKILGDQQEDFYGHVTSFNGSTVSGRFWIDKEERTVGFSVDRNHRLSPDQRSLLAESLKTWVQQDDGHVIIRGTPLTSKQGLLKQVFITSVRAR